MNKYIQQATLRRKETVNRLVFPAEVSRMDVVKIYIILGVFEIGI